MLGEVAAPSFLIGRPPADELHPHHGTYVGLVQGEDILRTLDEQRRTSITLLSGRDEADGDFRYAPEKWSVKQVLGHVCDTERVFSYRALCIARADATPLASFEQDDYVNNAGFDQRSLEDLVEDFIAVRRGTVSLLRNLEQAAWTRRGMVSGKPMTVRSIAYVIAGHELHHRRILEEKYFAAR